VSYYHSQSFASLHFGALHVGVEFQSIAMKSVASLGLCQDVGLLLVGVHVIDV
jgi:hypothetical protein